MKQARGADVLDAGRHGADGENLIAPKWRRAGGYIISRATIRCAACRSRELDVLRLFGAGHAWPRSPTSEAELGTVAKNSVSQIKSKLNVATNASPLRSPSSTDGRGLEGITTACARGPEDSAKTPCKSSGFSLPASRANEFTGREWGGAPCRCAKDLGGAIKFSGCGSVAGASLGAGAPSRVVP